MKSQDEITRAHDILTAFVLGNINGAELPPETMKAIHASADVLCWVLDHNHNDTFANNLAKLEQVAKQHGYTLIKLEDNPHMGVV